MANFIKSRTKAGGTGERAEAAHWIIALLDAAMILLNAIVEVLIGSVQHRAPKNAMNCLWISHVLVGGHALRFVPHCRGKRLFEKRPGCHQIACFTQHRVDQIAVAADGPLQIAPFAFHLHIRFVHIP